MRRSYPNLWRLGLSLLIAAPAPMSAQSLSRDAGSGVLALVNARIVTVTRGTIDRGTVVIRNGLIEAVGATVTPPPDARVLDVAGKTIYPGFIDLTSAMGLAAPVAAGRGGGRGNLPAEVLAFLGQQPDTSSGPRFVGLEPQRNVVSEIRLADADVQAARAQGITSVLIAPPRGVFRGLSALVPMRDDTAARWAVKSPVALHMGYETVPGQYPGSLLGVIAYQRQAFYDALRLAQISERYQSNPRGIVRPTYDEGLEALVPAVRGQLPVFIAANNENQMRRALALAREFGLKLTIVGATEGFRAIDVLKSAGPPVVSVDFPQPAQVTGWQYQYAVRNETDSATRAQAVQKLVEGNAAALHRAGIRFALASGGAAPNTFIANVKKAIAAGLPREVAVEALTIRPAEIAGVDQQLGSIEPGKVANLLVMEGEALTDGARLQGVLIDGRYYEATTAAPSGGRGGRGGRGGSISPSSFRE
jgi:imidazolonepropionase-like amidohydrolase